MTCPTWYPNLGKGRTLLGVTNVITRVDQTFPIIMITRYTMIHGSFMHLSSLDIAYIMKCLLHDRNFIEPW